MFIDAHSLSPTAAESRERHKLHVMMTGDNRWDEKAGLRRDAVRSQVSDVLVAQEIKETGNEEG